MSIKDLDFFALFFGFTYDKSVRFRTVLGGYLGLTFIIMLSGITAFYVIQFIDKGSNISFNTGFVKYEDAPSIKLPDIYTFAVGIYNSDLQNYIDLIDNSHLSVSLVYVNRTRYSARGALDLETEIPMKLCTNQDFDKKILDYYEEDALNKFLCPMNKSYEIKGSNEAFNFAYFSIKIYAINSTLDLSVLSATILYTDCFYNLWNFENPVEQTVRSQILHFSSERREITNIYYQELNFTSEDYSVLLWPISREFAFYDVTIEEKQTKSFLNSINNKMEIGTFNILSGINSKSIKRSYLSISTITTKVSGIMNVVFFVFTLINFFYAKTAFYTKLTKDSIFMFRDLLQIPNDDAKSTDLKDNDPTIRPKKKSILKNNKSEQHEKSLISLHQVEEPSFSNSSDDSELKNDFGEMNQETKIPMTNKTEKMLLNNFCSPQFNLNTSNIQIIDPITPKNQRATIGAPNRFSYPSQMRIIPQMTKIAGNNEPNRLGTSILNFSYGQFSPINKPRVSNVNNSQFSPSIKPNVRFSNMVSKLNYTHNNTVKAVEKTEKEVNSFHILRFINFKLSSSVYRICCLSFCCCMKRSRGQAYNEHKIFEFSRNYFEQYLDFSKFMEKFIELDLLKHFLFNEEQLKFINYLKKIIIVEDIEKHNIELHDLMKKEDLKVTHYQNLSNRLQKFYLELYDKENKSDIEKNLLEYLHKLTENK